MSSGILDYYGLLGLTIDASHDEIKKAFRKLAHQYHPDANKNDQSNATFIKLQEAYNTLSNEDKRKEYDKRYRVYFGIDQKIKAYQRVQSEEKAKKDTQSFDRDSLKSDFDEAAKRRWDMFQTYREQADSQIRETEIPIPNKPDIKGKVLDKVKSIFVKKIEKKTKDSQFIDQTEENFAKKFQFTISALESLNPSVRELVIEDGDNSKRVKVKIPALIANNSILKINVPNSDNSTSNAVEVRIRIENDEVIERDDHNITLRLPISPYEALSGAEIDVPTTRGNHKIKIPTPWNINCIVKIPEYGLFISEKNKYGDFFVKPYIVLPDYVNDLTLKAAKMLEESYNNDIRKKLPTNLTK
ncbi:MAG: DnaJ domain-containing protein [Proteobacteria bacterium]|nr:DnaJ domain-containing protein [Pseudomonadota bacterium]